MKRFLDKRIVIAEDNWLDNAPGSDILKPLYDPFSPAGRKAQQIDLQDDKAKSETIKRSELIVRTNADNKSEALGIFKNNNMSEDDFKAAQKKFSDLIKEQFGIEDPKGWICPKCNADRTKIACPLGFGATVDGRCPMTVEAQ